MGAFEAGLKDTWRWNWPVPPVLVLPPDAANHWSLGWFASKTGVNLR